MTIAIIRRDGATVGVAEADAQGIGVTTWFVRHTNQSQSYALEHDGYSVEIAEEIDCHDVAATIAAICERQGVTMESTFVPFSKSRHAVAEAGAKPWRSLNWIVSFKDRSGRVILDSAYAQGEGHAPASNLSAAKLKAYARRLGYSESVTKQKLLDHEIEHGKSARGYSTLGLSSGAAVPAPTIGDVLQSLARDSDVLDAGGFESWASDLGYDSDSRKAESIYRQCLESAIKLRSGLGDSVLAEIRLAASFN